MFIGLSFADRGRLELEGLVKGTRLEALGMTQKIELLLCIVQFTVKIFQLRLSPILEAVCLLYQLEIGLGILLLVIENVLLTQAETTLALGVDMVN